MGVRGWALWRLPRGAKAVVITVVGGYVALLATTALGAQLTIGRVAVATVFAALSVGSIEVSMRLAWPRASRNARVAHDCLGVWNLPVALLLPPIYVAVMVIVPCLYVQLRVWPIPKVKLAYSTASLALAYAGASAVHGAVFGQAGSHSGAAELVGSGRAALAVLAAVAAWWVVNYALVCAVVYLTSGLAPVRAVLRGLENHVVDVVAVCLGVAFAVLWSVSAAAALLLVPVVLLIQHHLYSDLRHAVRRDFLTDVASSRYWREVAGRELERAWASRRELAVLVIDVDHFKAVNDCHGHLVGDEALAKVASRIAQALRPSDLVGRVGGEEFAAVLSGLSLEEAVAAAERIRAQVAGLRVPADDGEVSVTVSCGVAALRAHGVTLNELLRAADRAMYAAKAAGRDRVRAAVRQRGDDVIDLTERTTAPSAAAPPR